MKRSLLVTVCLLLTPVLAPAADTKSPPTTPASEKAAAITTGDYAGKWKGINGASGELRIKLKQDAAVWSADVSFTFEDSPVPAKATLVKVEGMKFEMVIEWEIQGTRGYSKLTGGWKEDRLQGEYDSQPVEAASRGTWELIRA